MSAAMTGGCACGKVRFVAQVDWVSTPDWYESSAIGRRPYCASCGTSLGFQYKDGVDLDLTVASFDDPSRFVPTSHFGAECIHRAWLDTGGLAEQRSDDHAKLNERWADAGAAPPA